MDVSKIVEKINNSIAIKLTLIVSTIWCFYAFCALSVLPAMFPQWQNQILYISNCIQLAFLPLILVGQNLMGKKAEDQAAQDHEMIMAEFEEIKHIRSDLQLHLQNDEVELQVCDVCKAKLTPQL